MFSLLSFFIELLGGDGNKQCGLIVDKFHNLLEKSSTTVYIYLSSYLDFQYIKIFSYLWHNYCPCYYGI